MTVANVITIIRILLIPVFVLMAIYYGEGVAKGEPVEWHRYAAILVFLVAAASDGVDGYIARHYNQRSRLGVILDPIADKGLLNTAIITLSVSNWTYEFPLWFPVIVIGRDAVLLLGFGILHYLNGHVTVRPSIAGKITTFCQMTAIGWLMLQLPHHIIPVVAAGIMTLISGIGYVMDGIHQLHEEGHMDANV